MKRWQKGSGLEAAVRRRVVVGLRRAYPKVARGLRLPGWVAIAPTVKPKGNLLMRSVHFLRPIPKLPQTRRVRSEWIVIPRPDGSYILAALFRPRVAEWKTEGILYLQGGDYAGGSVVEDAIAASGLMRRERVVLAPYYRFAGHLRYIIGFKDAELSLRYLRDQADSWSIDPNGLRVIGAAKSAGGVLSQLLNAYEAETNEVPLTKEMLS